jgi:ABC-2 type transport system ATP-binding protein
MLEVRGLEVHRDGRPVLHDVSLSLPVGTIQAVVGRNGAGKTTLLEVIGGSVRRTRGSVQYANREIRRRDVTLLPTRSFLYPGLNGREYLELFTARNDRFDVAAWGESFRIPLDQWTERMSAGERQKLALVGALALARPLLLLDEPFQGLDIEAIELLRELLRCLVTAGVLVILTCHALEMMVGLANGIHLLVDGGLTRSVRAVDFRASVHLVRQEMLGDGPEIVELCRQVTPG